MKTLSSRDCGTTQQKAEFMLKACKPEWELYLRHVGGSTQFVEAETTGWTYLSSCEYWYELRPAPLSDAEKIKRALEWLEGDASFNIQKITKAAAILKGEIRD